ncbi:MAG: hypothetical protein KIT31_29365 [Deltaproteobacteria bacterium]|nr:hypothetical protein [Deltaproteobacteria bacterium]
MTMLPEAAQILGVVWRALDLQFSKRRAQSGRKFLRGVRPGSDATRVGVLRDMVRAFAEAGYVHVANEELLDRSREEIGRSLAHAIEHWDRFVGFRRGLARPVDATDVVRYLRLATIDIALRAAAFDIMFGWSPPPAARATTTLAEVPVWAREGGMRAWLRELPGVLGVSREEMHPGKSKDDWFYREGRPSIANLQSLASSLVRFDEHGRSDGAVARWRMYLAWGFALDALCDELAAIVGRATVEGLAAMFWRLRCLVWQIAAAVDPAHRNTLFGPILRAGARSDEARFVIGRIATVDGLAALNGGALDDRAAMLGIELRACQGMWILGDLFPGVHVPISPPDLPENLQQDLVAAMAPGADPAAFARVTLSHPASMVWALRLCVRRAFLDGSFAQVAPAVARFADALGETHHQLEAALLFLLAGDLAEARFRLERLDGEQAEVLRVVLDLVDGRASNSIPILNELVADDPSSRFPLAIALSDSGRHADALTLARELLHAEPGHALALALAARCAWAVGDTRAGNAYAKRATRLGQPVERPPRKRPANTRPPRRPKVPR